MSFVHLHNHSHYSLLESSTEISQFIEKASSYQMPALALTDNTNMFGTAEFYFSCQKKNINPILGLEVLTSFSSDKNLNLKNLGKLVFLAQNYKGYQKLCQISTQAYKNQRRLDAPVPFLDFSELNSWSSDLLVLTGGFDGWLAQIFQNQKPEQSIEYINSLKNIFGDQLYLEWNKHGLAYENEFHKFLTMASNETKVSLVGANNTYYLNPEDQIAQEILVCVGTNKTLQDETRKKLGSDQFYLKSSEQMIHLFKDHPDLVQKTLEVSERCKVKIKTYHDNGQPIYHLPSFSTQEGRTEGEELKHLSYIGLEERFIELKSRNEFEDSEKSKYFERLDFELKVIDQMGFNGYFLIVQDFIGWAKQNDIPVGPGRGSGAGSLVAYSLKITDLDPIKNNLIFERFLNPERISMPDFDIDFCQDRRLEVIKYVTEKYSADSVSQIITYGKLQTRAALRDVGRVLGFSFTEVNHICKLVPEKLGITITESLEAEPRFEELFDQDPKVKTLVDMALKIEGLVRHAGIHAAGVIIADGKIVDHAPLYIGSANENVVQYDMKHAEKIGLIKFDFLGLKTLTHIQNTFKLIERNRNKKISTVQISMSDPGIYELMQKGDTAGVFQFEGGGITSLITKAKPSRFEDLVAITALYRPGPMEMIPEYLKRKQGEVAVKYLFKELESVLEETYGIIVYQEQVQLIAAKIANYSLGEADMLRRAMGKKIASEMEQQKERFLKGAEENKHDVKKANELFDLMAEFAKYGFNKSHAAAYCVISAQTAWLKHYYPVEFLSALLSTEMSNTDNVVKYAKDAFKKGIKIKPPSVNISEYNFNVDGEDIIFSLGAIKGVGSAAVEAILEARNQLPDQKFESLDQFFSVVDLRRVNKKTIESLVKAGAFDEFGYNRRELFEGYTVFIEAQERERKDQEVGQFNLFAETEEMQHKVVLPQLEPYSKKEVLLFEKEVLGFYLSGHPLDGVDYLFETRTFLDEKTKKEFVEWPGLVSSKREIITKKGTRMAFLQIENQFESFEAIVFPDAFDRFKNQLDIDVPMIFTGKMEVEENQKKMFVSEVRPIRQELSKKTKIMFKIPEADLIKKINDFNDLFSQYPGPTQVYFQISSDLLDKKYVIKAGESKILPELEFIQKIGKLMDIKDMSFDLGS
jgi:DNA polymerase III subunit alpha